MTDQALAPPTLAALTDALDAAQAQLGARHEGRASSQRLFAALLEREPRQIDHARDVFERHSGFDDGTCRGCHPLGTVSVTDCPEFKSIAAVWPPDGAK